MEILIENLQYKLALDKNHIKKIVKEILKKEKITDAELSFVFVSAQRIMSLNKKFMKRAYVTDVLAFDLKDDIDNKLLGDIIISTDAVIQNSRIFKMTKEHELVLYIIHGILHLIGYDDHSAKEIKEMRAKEEGLLKFLDKKIFKVVIK